MLVPTAAFGLFVVRLGVVPAITVAIDQSPPLTVNLTIAARIAAVPLDHTFRWIGWLLVSMAVALMLVVIFREIALWLPRALDIG